LDAEAGAIFSSFRKKSCVRDLIALSENADSRIWPENVLRIGSCNNAFSPGNQTNRKLLNRCEISANQTTKHGLIYTDGEKADRIKHVRRPGRRNVRHRGRSPTCSAPAGQCRPCTRLHIIAYVRTCSTATRTYGCHSILRRRARTAWSSSLSGRHLESARRTLRFVSASRNHNSTGPFACSH
jgi:hypothetical protein